MKQTKVKKQTTNKPTLTVQEFIDKFPVGSIISFIESKSFIASGARSIFRIDRYEQTPRGYAFMYGIWCGFDFQTTNYKKEYNQTGIALTAMKIIWQHRWKTCCSVSMMSGLPTTPKKKFSSLV